MIKCRYCSPQFSTTWGQEINEHGATRRYVEMFLHSKFDFDAEHDDEEKLTNSESNSTANEPSPLCATQCIISCNSKWHNIHVYHVQTLLYSLLVVISLFVR